MNIFLILAIGTISGIISGMGIGGGTVLIPALIMVCALEQQQAQYINLIYFIPTAAIALVTHVKEGNIDKAVVKPLILWGILSAAAGAFIAISIDPGFLRKIFGAFMMLMGIVEFRKKDDKEHENEKPRL